MCGIAGIWGDLQRERLAAMAASLRHRGPDGEGFWRAPRDDLGFAHRRLAIIDLEGGRQPIANEDGGVVTVFNGAIYNYRELRDELTNRGHRFSTETDTEVIVHLYEEHGEAFPEKLRGMFAIALWDDARRQLLLARDRVGKKPLYYREGGGEFLFASEIKGVLAALPTRPTLDEQAVADFLTWAAIPAPGTIYQGINAVEPGHLLVVRDRSVVKRRRYWQQRMLPKERLTPAEAVDRVDEMLQTAVRLRLRSDVPVGCFLSGGIDSGIIAAIAAGQHGQPLTTITIGFDDDSFDERPLAALVAQRYGTDHHEIVIRPDVANDLPRIVEAYDQPFGDASAIPSFYAAEAARRHVKVILNGDGGDELFAGYRRYVAARINRLLACADGAATRPLWRLLSGMLPTPKRFRSRYAFAHRFIRGMGLAPVQRYLAWAVDGFDEAGLRGLFRADHEGRMFAATIEEPARFARTTLDNLQACGPVDRMLGADFATILPSDLLVKMDIATMAHGLEARSPLLDHELIDTVSRFPESLKLSGLQTKPLLRTLARRYLPESICRAPKRGFEIPLVRWLEGELRGLCEDVILARDGLPAELFDRGALERLVRSRQGLDPARWSRQVWLLLMLGMWDRCVYSRPPSTESVPVPARG